MTNRVIGVLPPPRAPTKMQVFVNPWIDHAGRNRNRNCHHRARVPRDGISSLQSLFQLFERGYKAICNREGQAAEVYSVQKEGIGS